MEMITENKLENNKNSINETELNIDQRIKIFANLIIDRIIEDKKRGVTHLIEEQCTNRKVQLPL